MERDQIMTMKPEFNRRIPTVLEQQEMAGEMTKTKATILAGSQAELARILGISPQAVSKWQGDSIPELQMFRLKEKKPRWFAKLRREQAQAQTENA